MLGRRKNAAYWEGWQAVELHRQCTYTVESDRKDWARGFAAGVAEERGAKMWYHSRTMIVGLSLLAVGVGLITYGVIVGGNTTIGIGSGLTASSILMTALRLITNSQITCGSGQYTPPL